MPKSLHRHSTKSQRRPSHTQRELIQSTDENSLKHYQPINRRQMKQFRRDFVRQWADDARQTCVKQHRKHQIKSFVDNIDHYSTASTVSSRKPRQLSSNNSATVHLQTNDIPEDLQCQIS